MKIRIIIEYDLDLPEDAPNQDIAWAVEAERHDWLEGNVDMHDVIATDGLVSFDIVES